MKKLLGILLSLLVIVASAQTNYYAKTLRFSSISTDSSYQAAKLFMNYSSGKLRIHWGDSTSTIWPLPSNTVFVTDSTGLGGTLTPPRIPFARTPTTLSDSYALKWDTVNLAINLKNTRIFSLDKSSYDDIYWGEGAGRFASTGIGGNIGLGYAALDASTTGNQNVGIGTNAGGAITTGTNVIAIGESALQTGTAPTGTVAIGYRAGELSTGTGNVFIGINAARLQTTGNNNISIGGSTGLLSTTASDQINIGNILYGSRVTSASNIFIQAENASTNDVYRPFKIRRTIATTPAAGAGGGIEFEMETQAAEANFEIGGAIENVFTDVTSTSEDADLVFKTMSAGATAAERVRFTSTGAIAVNGASNYGASGQFLKSNGNAPPTWASASGGGGGAADTVTVGTTKVVSGTNGYILYNNSGILGNATTGTGVLTALGVNIGSAGAPILFNGAGGTPSSMTGTNITGLPVTGLTGSWTNLLATLTGTAPYWSLASGGTFTADNTIAMAGFNLAFLNGNTLLGPTGATITANTRFDIRGIGTTTNFIQRLADSGNTVRYTISDKGQVIFTPSAFAGGSGIDISASVTDAAGNTQKLFNVALSGANATSTQDTFAARIANTKTGTSSTNYGAFVTASGGTSNIGLRADGDIGFRSISTYAAILTGKLIVDGDIALTTPSGTTTSMVGFGIDATGTVLQIRTNTGVVNLNTTIATFARLTGNATYSQILQTTGSPTFSTWTPAAHTTLTASAEATDINFNLARTVQFATGALTTQRAFRIQAPTYGFVGASTLTDAVTFEVGGSPVQGTNATFTRTWAARLLGDVGIGTKLYIGSSTGVVAPTALLHLAAGTATASTAPLKFTAPAALLTAPEALTIEPAINGDYLNLTTTTNTIRRVIVAGSTGRATGQTAANTSVATYTLGATDATYEVSANVLVTTSSAENFTVTVDYTDEGNTARTLTLNFQTIAGVIGTAINFANGAVPYEGLATHLKCKASTAITVKTTGTFTGVTYNCEGTIRQLN